MIPKNMCLVADKTIECTRCVESGQMDQLTYFHYTNYISNMCFTPDAHILYFVGLLCEDQSRGKYLGTVPALLKLRKSVCVGIPKRHSCLLSQEEEELPQDKKSQANMMIPIQIQSHQDADVETLQHFHALEEKPSSKLSTNKQMCTSYPLH